MEVPMQEFPRDGAPESREDVENLTSGSPLTEDDILWAKRAVHLSWVSICITLVAAIVGIWIGTDQGSVSVVGYALESFIDLLSSAFLIWRFSRFKDEPRVIGERRDEQADVLIAMTFIVLSFTIGGHAIENFVKAEGPDGATEILLLSGISLFFFIFLTAAKFICAEKTHSSAMRKDAWSSAAVILLSAALLVSAAVYHYHNEIWWLDATVAMMIALWLFVFGTRTLLHHSWWRRDFWKLS